MILAKTFGPTDGETNPRKIWDIGPNFLEPLPP